MTTIETVLAFNAFIWLCSVATAIGCKDAGVLLIPSALTILCGIGWMLQHPH